jgi:Ca2+-binding EF-hand superfamily protein
LPAAPQTTAGQPQAAAGNARRQTPFDAFDSNGDGHISRAEATPSLRRQWSQIDTNRDGTLERSELSAFEQQLRSDAREQGGRKQ